MNITTYLKNLLAAPRVVAAFALGLLMAFSLTSPVIAQAVLQGYNSDEDLQTGMMVTLKDGDATKVEAVTDKTLDKVKGVIADANDSPVTVSGDADKVFVATQGPYSALVSNENGSIKQGDYISVSSMAGIGMKADPTQSTVVGRAVTDFEGAGDKVGTAKTKSGQEVTFGRIKVDVAIGKNPFLKSPEKDKVPDAIQKFANTVAEKPVSSLKIYLALAVLLISAGVAAVTLFSGVRSTIISIGRNPLSKGVILRGLVQVLIVSLIIFITGLFGVYLLIKL
jgi:hypothetical protein